MGKWPALYCSAGRQSTRKKRKHLTSKSFLLGWGKSLQLDNNSFTETGIHNACESSTGAADGLPQISSSKRTWW